MWTLQFLVISLLLVDYSESSIEGYIARDIGGDVRHCIPISNCPPEDTCASCLSGRVQPDYIQSTVDANLTKCFKNKNKCRAHDLEPSREKGANGCGSEVEFCKCDTDQCYFGDPCICKHHKCDMDETMHTNGSCIKCPPKTRKNDSECGPCLPFDVPDISTQVTQRIFTSTETKSTKYVTTGIETLPLTERYVVVTLIPSIGIPPSKDETTHGRAKTPDSNEKTLIIVVVVLSVLVVVCIVVVIFLVLLRKRKRNTNQDVIEQGKFLVSANGNNTMKNDNDVNGNQDEAGSNIENEVNKDNVNDQSITSINDSRRDVFCSDNELSNNGKAIEVRNVEELPIVITGIVESKKDMSFPVEHSDVDRIDITVGEQLIAENTEADYMEKHTQMSLLRAPRLDKDSLNTNSTTGNAQLTEHSLKPVRQVSHESLDQNRDEVSSGYGSEEFPRSPMSYDKGPGSLQTYGDLVSVSVSNGSTEGTEVITSGLESFNYKLTGQTSPVHRESIQPKQIIVKGRRFNVTLVPTPHFNSFTCLNSRKLALVIRTEAVGIFIYNLNIQSTEAVGIFIYNLDIQSTEAVGIFIYNLDIQSTEAVGIFIYNLDIQSTEAVGIFIYNLDIQSTEAVGIFIYNLDIQSTEAVGIFIYNLDIQSTEAVGIFIYNLNIQSTEAVGIFIYNLDIQSTEAVGIFIYNLIYKVLKLLEYLFIIWIYKVLKLLEYLFIIWIYKVLKLLEYLFRL
ncbi:unnamed protein product [Mytilus edulis]|uniref:Uncharacterized protein n=1 Tax=Mytilus edulis TaxID=6550 RepID=A0A8S3Q497_MYTED|nr:unnamed protein product [Mytilus edulis]